MDWSEKDLCIKCDRGGNLLVCSENGCPLSVHKECMGCPARFDESGNFYCPYCLYKKAFAESCRARKDAMEKKKALLIFIDEEPNERTSEGKRHDKKSQEATVNIDDSSLNDTEDKSKPASVPDRSVRSDVEHMVGGNKEEGKNKIRDDHSGPSFIMREDREFSETEDNTLEEDDSEASSGSTDQDPSFQLRGEDSDATEEDMIEDDDTNTCSNSSSEDHSVDVRVRAERGSKRGHLSEGGNNDVPLESKHIDKNKRTHEETVRNRQRSFRTRPSSSGLGNNEASDEDSDDLQISEELPQQPSVKSARHTLRNMKRKKLMWSPEEEETLEKGVLKYSEPDKNIPWRKILEYGRKVFNITRTPADLKDKWRKMVAK